MAACNITAEWLHEVTATQTNAYCMATIMRQRPDMEMDQVQCETVAALWTAFQIACDAADVDPFVVQGALSAAKEFKENSDGN